MSQSHRFFFNDRADSWHNKTAQDALIRAMSQFGMRGNDRVLDIGAGRGALTLPLSTLVKTGFVVAADLSDKMLCCAKKNLNVDRALYVCADACAIAFPDEVFDKIICYSTFPHIQKPLCALSEFLRILKPRGKALIFHNCCSRKLNHFHAKLPQVVSFDKLPKSQQLQALMSAVGFREIKTIERPDLYWVEAEKR
jgi:demethylmenaquinone methyltransferase/2-methoxy-6-polyprenyl-1,4-benzoquinol methylase